MRKFYWIVLLILLGACKDKFMPEIHFPQAGFLVVEGFINTGSGPTTITLTRAAKLDSISIIPEPGAQVEVQSEGGASFPLTEQAGGKYSIDSVPAIPGQRYRLHIKTSNGKEYFSDLADVKLSPPIDSVSWKAGTDDLTIYVSTHDSQNKSLYYQWSFAETWKYNSAYDSKLAFDPTDSTIYNRLNDSLYTTCWSFNQSTDILIGSTANLSSDVLHEFPLTKISYSTTNRLVVRYSILVTQTVLTKDWYEWKEKLKKNTEQLGSIFDPQPSETGGNIHCSSDPLETVVGFVGCSSQTQQRIFIDRSQVPAPNIFTGYELCELDTVGNDKSRLYQFFGTGFQIPIQPYINSLGITIAYYASTSSCVDCRFKGGSPTQPDFWK
jgi:hypothetical protein